MDNAKKKASESTILMIGHDCSVYRMLEDLPAGHGFRVKLAASWKNASPMIQEKPSLILLGRNLPDGSDMEILPKIRALDAAVPVVFISTGTDPKLVAGIARMGDRNPIAQSETDDSTGLCNMRAMYNKIDFEISRAKQYRRWLSCSMLDLDDYKQVVDCKGDLFASFVIREVARIISKNIRKVDFAARYGGDEFLLVFPEADEAAITVILKRLQAVFWGEKFQSGGQSAGVSFHMGYVALPPAVTMTARTLVHCADTALLAAKEVGRNKLLSYWEMNKNGAAA